GELEGGGQGDGEGHVLGSGAAPVLLPAAVDQRLDRQPAPDGGSADALGGTDLVAGDAHGIGSQSPQVQPAGGLHRVGVQQRSYIMGDSGESPHIGDRSDLVVGVGQGDQGGVLSQHGPQGAGGDLPIGADLD